MSDTSTKPEDVVSTLLFNIGQGRNATIVKTTADKIKNPPMKTNPLLDDPNNWEADKSYNSEMTRIAAMAKTYFNETERDLTLNWDELYLVTRGENKGKYVRQPGGKATQLVRVRLKNPDVREKCLKWKPKPGIEQFVPNPDQNLVCYQVVVSENVEQNEEQRRLAARLEPGTHSWNGDPKWDHVDHDYDLPSCYNLKVVFTRPKMSHKWRPANLEQAETIELLRKLEQHIVDYGRVGHKYEWIEDPTAREAVAKKIEEERNMFQGEELVQ